MCRALLAFLVLWGLSAGAAQVRLPVIADTSLQAHPAEVTHNSGGTSNIRIKGNEHLLLLKFDLAPVADWRVERAVLWMHNSSRNSLRTLGFSTVAADWGEGTGRSEESEGGCCFLRAFWPDGYWAGPGTDFLDVVLTNGLTRMGYADVAGDLAGWISVEVPPAIVQAMIAGGSFGLCVSDEKGQTRANNDMHSREQSAFAPYMIVDGAPLHAAPPELLSLSAEPWPRAAGFAAGAVAVKLSAPEAFRYEARIQPAGAAEQPVPLYRIPWPGVGAGEVMILPDLPPGQPVRIRVAAVDATGQRGPWREVTCQASTAKPLPQVQAIAPVSFEPGAEPPAAGGLRAWALPAECKVSPVSGNVLEEVGAGAYDGAAGGHFRRWNTLWDGKAAHLQAARGEVASLQVVVEPQGTGADAVTVTFEPDAQAAMPTPVGIWRNWYVQQGAWFAEYMVTPGQAIPAADNAVPGQRNQSFTLVWEVPRDASGTLSGTVRVRSTAGDGPAIPVTLQVQPYEIPARTSFQVDLNCYGLVASEPDWQRYLQIERRYFAAAHALRCNLNTLGYSHRGTVTRGYAPTVAGNGADTRITDWREYDERWGPYLDGSAFSGVRAGVPVSAIYLPFHENWPTPIAGHYTGGNDLRKYPDNIALHAMEAPPVEQAFDQEFKDAFVSVTRQFAEHFRARGWTETQVQCYQNNKYYYKDEKSDFRGVSWWLLDEPMHRDDWLALAFFARLFREGAAGTPNFIWRGDISRPQWQRNWLDGLADLMCVSSELFSHGSHCRRMMDRWPVAFWHYGTANAINATNLSAEAWALKAYCAGADGILPWNSIGGNGAYTSPEPTSLLIPGARFGITGPVVSLRLLALCRGQQNIELLNLLAARRGYDRDQIARVVADLVSLDAQHRQQFLDDAGQVVFDRLTPEALEGLRRSISAALQ
jgi:hypothetical protein